MYDTNVEAKVLSWFKALLNEDLTTGMKDVENQLRDGQILIRLLNNNNNLCFCTR